MQNTETTTENTHSADCFTNQETKAGACDFGCTCNWSAEDDAEWSRWTD